MNLDLDLGIEWSEKQWAALTFRAPPHPTTGEPQIDKVAFLGEYGGGKTFSAAARFFLVCAANPFVHGVHSGEDRPMSAIVAPTLGDLKKGPLKELRKLLGDAWDSVVIRERLYGEYQDVDLVNGHRIVCYSAKGALNGPSLCQIWPDEIQERCYIGQWPNYEKRVRDVRSPWLNVQVSGIAERGFVEDTFRLREKHPEGIEFTTVDGGLGNRLTTLIFPEDNKKNLGSGYIDDLEDRLPASRQRDEDGWLLPQDVMYPSFSRDRHVRIPPGVKGARKSDFTGVAASISADFGRSGALMWGLPFRARVRRSKDRSGLFVVDQRMPDNMDAEEMAQLARRHSWIRGVDKPSASKWCIDPKRSVICLDPTAENDQVRHFRKAFPGVRVIQVQRGFYHKEENGVRAVDRALLDMHGNVRLFIAPWLKQDPSTRGVVEMFSGYLSTKPKDKHLEHASDVARYLTQHWVPLPSVTEPMSEEADRILSRVKPTTAGLTVADLG